MDKPSEPNQTRAVIDRLIVNTPYDPPQRHWALATDKRFELVQQRRPAGYYITDPRYNSNRFVKLDLAERIRERVAEWKTAEYLGITSVTHRLLEHWHDRSQREHPFYFCQLEAIETLIWWVEAHDSFKQGIAIPADGGPWERLCSKMATGTGKTTVMAMIIAWQVVNALTYPQRKEFSRAVFIVTPGLTVKERLQVLHPSHSKNYYDEFNVVPSSAYRDKLNQVALLIENWHSLMPLKPPERSVKKLGPESDRAFTDRVLKDLGPCKNMLVINDEAHHAYRIPAELKAKRIEGLSKEDQEEATRWIEGLDRIHKTRRILRCFDLSATPFAPTGKKTTEEALFPWIVSDFSLNDAIEAGLVKTPRVVVRDDALPVNRRGVIQKRRSLRGAIASTLAGIQDVVTKVTMIDLQSHAENFRFQHLVFHASRKAYESLNSKSWKGEKHILIFQIIRIVEQFLNSDKLIIASLFHQEELRKRILLAMTIDRIVQHICQFIRQTNTQRLEPVFDRDSPIGSTAYMRTWYTSKPCHPTLKSQISHAVFDSGWESAALFALDDDGLVQAYAKNDHLDFYVLYLFNGAIRKYYPDYLIRLRNGKVLVLEIKGQPNDESRAKRAALARWVLAVNANGGFGQWCHDEVTSDSDIRDILAKHNEM